MIREILLFPKIFNAIKNYFSQEKVLESGAILLAKISSSLNHRRFIGHKVIIPRDEDYLKRTPVLIVYQPCFMERIFEQCIEKNFHLVEFHSHPFSKHNTTFSNHDDYSERQVLGPYITKYFKNLHLANVVCSLDMNSMDARMWSPWIKNTIAIDRIKIIGIDNMMILPTTSSYEKNHNKNFDSEIHHRTVLAFGNAAQQRYSMLKIGLIGCGGLGSVVGELLARLGINTIVTVDNDVVEKTNLNRLTGATTRDAQYKRSKVQVMERELSRSNPRIKVNPIQDDFLNPEVQQEFKHCDIFFGCTDSVAARLAINRLALANDIPYFDLGSGAKAENGKLAYAGGQAIKVVPHGNFCLHCSDYFSKENLALEMMGEKDRAASVQMGYLSGDIAEMDATAQPAVYALNSMTASNAVWWMMRYVSGDAVRIDGIAIDAMNYTTWPWTHSEGTNKDCPICGEHGFVGLGDEAPLMQMSSKDSVPVLPATASDNADSHDSYKEDDSKKILGSKVDLTA